MDTSAIPVIRALKSTNALISIIALNASIKTNNNVMHARKVIILIKIRQYAFLSQLATSMMNVVRVATLLPKKNAMLAPMVYHTTKALTNVNVL